MFTCCSNSKNNNLLRITEFLFYYNYFVRQSLSALNKQINKYLKLVIS